MDLRFLYWRSRTGSQSHFFDDVLTFQVPDLPLKGHVKKSSQIKSVTMCYPQKLAEVCIHPELANSHKKSTYISHEKPSILSKFQAILPGGVLARRYWYTSSF